MPPAWQVRDWQQREFIREFMREVYEQADEEENADAFLLDVLGVTIARVKHGETPLPVTDSAGYLLVRFLEKVRAFTNTRAEGDYLLCMLAEELEKSAFAPFFSAWSEKQFMDSRAALGSSSASDDVVLPHALKERLPRS